MEFKNFITECKKRWKWFVTATVTTLLLAILFLLMVAPQYERSATILIKDENGSGGLLSSMASGMGMLAGMAGLHISSNVNNEMEIMSAPAMMMEVIKTAVFVPNFVSKTPSSQLPKQAKMERPNSTAL